MGVLHSGGAVGFVGGMLGSLRGGGLEGFLRRKTGAIFRPRSNTPVVFFWSMPQKTARVQVKACVVERESSDSIHG